MQCKHLFGGVFFLLFFQPAFSQANRLNFVDFDKSLQQLTDALALKLKKDSALKMAIWDLSDLNGGVSPIGKYIAEDISINLSDKFHITNRNQLSTMLKENQLASEGFINQVTFKQVKKLSDIDILITGTVSVLSDNIKITLQALDVNMNIVGATKGEVLMNADVKELLGINSPADNKGFNRPLNSNEQNNNPATVSNSCEGNNTGDYCFYNNTSGKIMVYINRKDNNGDPEVSRFALNSKESKCIYNNSAGVYTFIASSSMVEIKQIDIGEFLIEKCKSKTYAIN
jgi:hypothetical protein